jgi:hypothetical protein
MAQCYIGAVGIQTLVAAAENCLESSDWNVWILLVEMLLARALKIATANQIQSSRLLRKTRNSGGGQLANLAEPEDRQTASATQ